MILYAARHGETEGNRAGLMMGGGGNAPLTEAGVQQAKALGQALASVKFDAVYSSPLQRAIDTVHAAFGEACQPIPDDRLLEIDLGVMEGMTFPDAVKKFPRSALMLMPFPTKYLPPPQGEKPEELIARVDSFLSDLAKKDYENVFVLTHGYVLRALYSCVHGKTVKAIGKAPAYQNCQFSRYSYSPETGLWTLLP